MEGGWSNAGVDDGSLANSGSQSPDTRQWDVFEAPKRHSWVYGPGKVQERVNRPGNMSNCGPGWVNEWMVTIGCWARIHLKLGGGGHVGWVGCMNVASAIHMTGFKPTSAAT